MLGEPPPLPSSLPPNLLCANKSGSSSSPGIPSPPRQKRQFIANEILASERSYLATLNDIERIFILPLRDSGILTQKNIADLFSNVSDIIKINTELLSMLTERMLLDGAVDYFELCIGDIFLYLSPFLKIYSIYVKNYQNALRVASELERKNGQFAAFLQNAIRSPECKGRGLQAFILAPVQRIPRYKLLLDDLLKHTPEEHQDYENLSKALRSIESVANFVNEMIREHEGMVQMLELQRSLSGLNEDIIKPGRKLLKQGILIKICRKTSKPRVVFLFSDMLLYAAISRTKTHVSSIASPKSLFLTQGNNSIYSQQSVFMSGSVGAQQSFIFHRKFELDGMEIVNVKDSELMQFCFQIKTVEKSFAVLCSNENEKRSWIEAIDQAIENLKRNRSTLRLDSGRNSEVQNEYQAPVWVPDNATLTCMNCNSEFTLVRRRHHCRLCGKVVCGPCSAQRVSAVYINDSTKPDDSVRVCDVCYTTISKKEHMNEFGSVSTQDKNYISDSDDADDDDQEAIRLMRKTVFNKSSKNSLPIKNQSRQRPNSGNSSFSYTPMRSNLMNGLKTPSSSSKKLNNVSTALKTSLYKVDRVSPGSIQFADIHSSANPLLSSSISSGTNSSGRVTNSPPVPIRKSSITTHTHKIVGGFDFGPKQHRAQTSDGMIKGRLLPRPRSITDISEQNMPVPDFSDFVKRNGGTSDPDVDAKKLTNRFSKWTDAISTRFSRSSDPPWITNQEDWRPQRTSNYFATPFANISELTLKLAIAGLRPTKSQIFEIQQQDSISRDIECHSFYERKIIKEGYLMKRGKRFKSWKSRWVILSPLHLCWYKPHVSLFNQEEAPLADSPLFLGSLSLLDCVETGHATKDELSLPSTGRRTVLNVMFTREEQSPFPDLDPFESAKELFPFKFVTPWRTLYMVAATNEERDEWLIRLTKAVKDAIIINRTRAEIVKDGVDIDGAPPIPPHIACPPTPPSELPFLLRPEDLPPPPPPSLSRRGSF